MIRFEIYLEMWLPAKHNQHLFCFFFHPLSYVSELVNLFFSSSFRTKCRFNKKIKILCHLNTFFGKGTTVQFLLICISHPLNKTGILLHLE